MKAIVANRAPAADGVDAPVVSARRQRTRQALIDAAERLMAVRSVDAVSIDDIVDTAGVAKGSFYNHFPDKEALQHAALEAIRVDLTDYISRLNTGIADPARRVARAFATAIGYSLEQPRRGNFMIRTAIAFRLIEARMNEGLIQDIGVGVSEGRFRIASTESGAVLMLGITQAALVRTLDCTDRSVVVAQAQQLGAMLLRGLGLDHAEAETIAAHETDRILGAHDFAAPAAG